ncbi:hypothetical protein [Streptomyces sp. NRRL F-2580]|uniref:hypothetical protein n=1 Tax=Streptomyces sp. NRRL F-2580 TaxID=1463841 RepID=UPI00131C47F6|nr:hypothetical protein [Streptomyces sp. NRRL F-2580]
MDPETGAVWVGLDTFRRTARKPQAVGQRGHGRRARRRGRLRIGPGRGEGHPAGTVHLPEGHPQSGGPVRHRGAEVSLTAQAEGAPRPTVAWQVSTDAGRNLAGRARRDLADPHLHGGGLPQRQPVPEEFTIDAGAARTEAATLTVTAADTTTGGGPSTGGTGDGSGTSGSAAGGTAGGSGGGSGGGAADSAGGSASGSGGAGASGASVGGTGAAPIGGALASTGSTVASLAAVAIVLTAGGRVLAHRTRPRRNA